MQSKIELKHLKIGTEFCVSDIQGFDNYIICDASISNVLNVSKWIIKKMPFPATFSNSILIESVKPFREKIVSASWIIMCGFDFENVNL